MVISVMPTRWMTLACWLSRGRSSTADCALPRVAAKRVAMNKAVSTKFLRILMPPGGISKLCNEVGREFRREARTIVSAGLCQWGQLIFQLSVHGNFCVEQLGDGAALLGILCGFFEFGSVGARNFDFHLQMGRSDSKAGVEFFQRYGGRGVNGLRRHSSVAELG